MTVTFLPQFPSLFAKTREPSAIDTTDPSPAWRNALRAGENP
ncbi:hypothetical protein SAMN05444161_8292 [Rhizobiales bacterium GAS191]|jgi:hypothetical protein|nr:hypothetical protein SAMN05444161_8292 [Rhizobiales bacterium GAS191]